jgi:hypothetical protein
MTPESVLRRAPLVLDQRAREQYFEDGYLTVPGYVGAAWLARLRAVVAAKIEESRGLSASDDQFDLAPDHTADKPNIRRLCKAIDRHPDLWAFAVDGSVVDLIADLLGPDLRFHSSKLNFKWAAGGDAVRWHSKTGVLVTWSRTRRDCHRAGTRWAIARSSPRRRRRTLSRGSGARIRPRGAR